MLQIIVEHSKSYRGKNTNLHILEKRREIKKDGVINMSTFSNENTNVIKTD